MKINKTSTEKSKPIVSSKAVSHRHSKASVPVTPVPVSVPAAPTADEIARRAHAFWIERNYAHGHADEDWLRAEKVLSAGA